MQQREEESHPSYSEYAACLEFSRCTDRNTQTHLLTHTCIFSRMWDHMQIRRQNSLREDIMTCGLTDEEMTVNAIAEENFALQTLYSKAPGILPILLYTKGNWAVIIPLKPNVSSKCKLQRYRFVSGYIKHCN